MNLFEIPPIGEMPNRPATMGRVLASLVCGTVAGVGVGALTFGLIWSDQVVTLGGSGMLPWGPLWFMLLGSQGVLIGKIPGQKYSLLWRWGGWLVVAVSAGAILWAYRDAELAAWTADRDFLTLIIFSTLSGALIVAAAFSKMTYLAGRVAFWPAAALALWFTCEWAVKLGPAMDRWDGPRTSIALFAVILTGAFCLFGALTAIDWRIRKRDVAERLHIENETV